MEMGGAMLVIAIAMMGLMAIGLLGWGIGALRRRLGGRDSKGPER